MILINPELGQLELSFLVLSQKCKLLLLALKFGFVLFDQHIFVLLKLELSLLIKTILFFAEKFLLLFLVLTK